MELSALGGNPIDSEKSVGAISKLSDNFGTFLTLLITQLRNQDPLDPMDSSEFTSQLVQFSTVEQAIATNKNLEKLIGLSTADQLNSAVNFIGHDVKARGSTTVLKDGKAEWEFQNDQLMESVTILVFDENDKIVYVTDAPVGLGIHEVVWDGKDNSGALLPDGNYSLTVSAVGTDGEALSPTIFVFGRVTGVQTADGESMLTVNGNLIPLNEVLSILESKPREPTL
jgi:flagellar basal-body rod modification protein FlgD